MAFHLACVHTANPLSPHSLHKPAASVVLHVRCPVRKGLPVLPPVLLRALTEADIQPQLTRRRPGQSRLTTPRAEKDMVTIMSGTEFGYTLGTPIGLFVPNEDQRPGDYKEMSMIPRPGHADFTYQLK